MKSTLCVLIVLGVFNLASTKPKIYLIETVDKNGEAGTFGELYNADKGTDYLHEIKLQASKSMLMSPRWPGAREETLQPKIALKTTFRDESNNRNMNNLNMDQGEEEYAVEEYRGERGPGSFPGKEGEEKVCSRSVECGPGLACAPWKNTKNIKTCQTDSTIGQDTDNSEKAIADVGVDVWPWTAYRDTETDACFVFTKHMKCFLKEDLKETGPGPDSCSGQDADNSNFETGDVVTVTAKFWYVSDFESNATEYADGYVRSVNCALRNSRIPVRYKRWGSVQRLPRSHTEMIEETRGESSTYKFNNWFINSLGTDLESHQTLKQSADHIVLMHNEIEVGNAGACLGYGPDSKSIDGEFDGTYSTLLIGSGGGWGFGAYEKTFIHEVGHCLGVSNHNGTCLLGAGENGKPMATLMMFARNFKEDLQMCVPCCGGGNEWIFHFSNPDVFYKGIPTGSERNNNAKVITEESVKISQHGDECWDGFPDENGNMKKLC